MKPALPDNTTDRLLAVADIIEFQPERWDQGTWFQDAIDIYDFPERVIGRGFPSCGTVGCVAGWATALTPKASLPHARTWDAAGRIALGFDWTLADAVFDGSLRMRMDHVELADVLRRLAKLDERGRTADAARDVLTDAQLRTLDFEGYGASEGDDE